MPSNSPSTFNPSGSNPSGPAPFVLVVEDSRTQAAMLRHLLQQNGYEAGVAADGAQALQMAGAQKPDLVISDILMPVLDGYAMCSALKAEPQLRDVPVILLTSLDGATDIVKGLQAGADYYLTKPFDAPYLLAMVASVLSRGGSDAARAEEREIEVEVEGQHYFIGAGRRQMLNLLLSTYSNAVLQNRLLQQTQHELRAVNAQLVAQRAQIEAQGRELREANRQLLEQATRDSLTGLHNLRALRDRLSEETARAQRHQEALSLLLLDVDNFKGYNDSFGHPAGDEILMRVARVLEEQARHSDFVARYGGEEFVLLLPKTDVEAARHAAERVRSAIENAAWPHRAITASLGAATTCVTADATVLLAQADAALYTSKKAGRNCVVHVADLQG